MDKHIALRQHLEFKKTSVNKDKVEDIERYLKLFLNSNKKELDKFDEQDLTKFINSLEADYSTRTINDIKVFVKVFIKWYYADYSSRFRNLDKICQNQKPEKAYTPEQMLSLDEIKKLVEGEKDLMYKTYWMTFAFGGFRPSEACGLKWNQVDFDTSTIKIHTTKTGKDFYKGLPKEAMHLLSEWKKHNGSEYVFPSPVNQEGCITARSICKRLKKLSLKVLGKDVVPYQIRHSIATELYKDDKRKDDDTANQLGHTKSMKNVYLNLDENSLKAKARSIWIKVERMKPEEKANYLELKKEMEDMKYTIEQLKKQQGGKIVSADFSNEEYSQLRKKADKYNMTLPELINRAGKKYLMKAKT